MKNSFKRFYFLLLLLVTAFSGTVIFANTTNGKINLEKTATKIYEKVSNDNLKKGRFAKVNLSVGANDYTVSSPTKHLDIVLVMDGSSSMNGQRIVDAKKAASDFTNSLIKDGDNVRIGVVEYATTVKDVLNLSSNRTEAINFINDKYNVNTGSAGGTNLQAGINKASQLLSDSRSDAKKVVIILTDGVPTFFYYNNGNNVYGTGSNNNSVCVDGIYGSCKKYMTPSEAAKIELDNLKNGYKNSDIYTITFGNEPLAASILKEVNPENNEPLYKNYTALTGSELQSMFNLIEEHLQKIIGKNAVVTDIIPASFKLTSDSKSDLMAKGVKVLENSNGTTTLIWNVNEISSEFLKTLSYEVRAEDDFHGSMFTNESAVLSVEVDKSNPFYEGKTKLNLEFKQPTVEIPAITLDDNYSEYASYVGFENQKIKGTSILTNDKLKNKLTDSTNEDKVLVSDSIVISENSNVVKNDDGTFSIYKDSKLQGKLNMNEDGTFTFMPEENVIGEVSFDYQVVSKIAPYKETNLVYSNISKVTLNILAKAKTDISGKKIWQDNNDQDGLRPSSIDVGLYADDVLISSKKLSDSNKWSYTFNDLDVYENGYENDNSHMINYQVKELSKVQGYTTTYANNNIINTHDVLKVTVSGVKTWVDNDDQDGLRPDSITIKLFANGNYLKSTTVTKDNNWKYSFTNLDKNSNGNAINYTIQEEKVDGYEINYDKFNITNTHAPMKIDITGEKKWVDANDKDGLRPDSVTIDLYANGKFLKSVTATKDNDWKYSFKNLNKYENGNLINYKVKEKSVTGYETSYDESNPFIIVNTHNPRDIVISGTKKWIDRDNIYGRPNSITVNLYANGEYLKSTTVTKDDNWKYSFTGLPEYENGNLINYTVTENAVRDYDTIYKGFDIENKYNPETINISGIKTWDDFDNQDGIRPDSITVILKANGTEVKRLEVSSDKSGKWSYNFNNLIKYANGTLIKYTLEEVGVNGYNAVINDFDITNTHVPEKVSFKVQKSWNDYDNNDGIRPDSITVKLLANGVVVATEKISSDNNWTYVFEGFDKYQNGSAIEYQVEEDLVKGYTTTIEKSVTDSETSFDIVNAHEKETTDLVVNKIWNDYNNKYNKRPDSIVVRLYGNGKLIDTVIISKNMNWMYTFKGLPKYENGEVINYVLVENSILNYSTSYDGNTIINTYNKKISEANNSEIIPPYTGVKTNNDTIVIILSAFTSVSLMIVSLFEKKRKVLF